MENNSYERVKRRREVRKKILIMCDMQREYLETIHDILDEHGIDMIIGNPLLIREEELIRQAEDCSFIIAGSERWSRRVLESIRRSVGIIVRCGTGYDGVDIQAATDFGIVVANTPGLNINAVAEMTFSLILALQRKLKAYDCAVRKGNWSSLEVQELSGKNIGFIGFGNIAKKVAMLMSGLECNLLAYDVIKDAQAAKELHVRYAAFGDIVRCADVLSLHLPLNSNTANMINKEVFDVMKIGCILINTSRGRIVNESDLAAALASGRLGGAGLDVHAIEPIPMNSPILKYDNVIVTPHAASSTREAKLQMIHACAMRVIQHCNGEAIDNQILLPSKGHTWLI